MQIDHIYNTLSEYKFQEEYSRNPHMNSFFRNRVRVNVYKNGTVQIQGDNISQKVLKNFTEDELLQALDDIKKAL